MRKFSSFMAAAVAMLAAVSCNKEINNIDPVTPGADAVVYTAYVDGAETKTSLGATEGEGEWEKTTTRTQWDANDKITIHDGIHGYTFTTTDSGSSAKFTTTEEGFAATKVMAIYPAGDYKVDVENKTVNASIPTWQQAQIGTYHSPAALAVAYSDDNALQFKNATALLKFTVNTDNVTHVVFHGKKEEAITGNVKVTLGAEGVEVNCLETEFTEEQWNEELQKNEEVKVTKFGTWVECYAVGDECLEKGKTYYLAVAPNTFEEGVTVKVRINKGNELIAKTTTKRVETKANTILDLGEIEYTAPGAESSGWSLPGTYNNWNTTETFLYEEGDYYVAKNVSGLSTGFKFQHAEFGWKGVGSTDPVADGQWHKLNGDADISLKTNDAYDIYMTKDGSQFQAVATGSPAPEAPEVVADFWGLIGSMAGSAWATDLKLVAEGDYLVVKGVALTTTDEFKFRKNGEWNEQKIAKGGLAEANTEYDCVDAGQSNMKIKTAGTYDIYVKKDLTKVYFMNSGKTPAQATQPDMSNVYRFYVQNNVGWANLNFYAWGGYTNSWPGDAMTKSASVDSYGTCKYVEITKGVGVVNFIINNGSKQTKDLQVTGNTNVKTLANGDMIYILTSADVKN